MFVVSIPSGTVFLPQRPHSWCEMSVCLHQDFRGCGGHFGFIFGDRRQLAVLCHVTLFLLLFYPVQHELRVLLQRLDRPFPSDVVSYCSMVSSTTCLSVVGRKVHHVFFSVAIATQIMCRIPSFSRTLIFEPPMYGSRSHGNVSKRKMASWLYVPFVSNPTPFTIVLGLIPSSKRKKESKNPTLPSHPYERSKTMRWDPVHDRHKT